MTLLMSRRSLTLTKVRSAKGLRIPELFISFRSIAVSGQSIPKVSYIDNEAEFRWALCEDEMATDKLNEGIRKFAQDGETLKGVLRQKIAA